MVGQDQLCVKHGALLLVQTIVQGDQGRAEVIEAWISNFSVVGAMSAEDAKGFTKISAPNIGRSRS